MKKFKYLTQIIIITTLILTFRLQIGNNYIINPVLEFSLANNHIINETITIKKSNYELINQLLKLPKEYDSNEVEGIINRLSLYDNRLLEELIDCNAKIILTNNQLTDIPELQYLKGNLPKGRSGSNTWDYVPGLSTINTSYIRIGYSYPSKETNHGSLILELHETSHLIDYCALNNISNSDEFKNIHFIEKEKLFPNNNYYNYIEEYFAESFTMYFYSEESKNQLKKYAPLTFEYYKLLIDNL